MGYRYYETAGVKVRFPFGYGLSYTKFVYSDLNIEGNRVSCTVKNIGEVTGNVKEGFEKVELAPGESKKVTFTLDERSFAVWADGWKIPTGEYKICIGRSCQDICLLKEVHIDGAELSDDENLPKWYRSLMGTPSQSDLETLLGRKIMERPIVKGKFSKESTVKEMKEHSLIMKLVYFGMETVMAKKFGGRDYSNPTFKMMMTTAMDCSVSGMQINGGIKGHLLEGLVEIANGRLLKGIGLMLKK